MGITTIVQKHNKLITDFILLFLFAGLLQFTSNSLTKIDCITFFAVIILISVPVYLSIKELPLLKHRLFIESTWRKESHVHKFFWKAIIKKVSLYVISVLITLGLIFTTSLFETSHWVLIYIDIIAIILLNKIISENVNHQVKHNYNGLITRNYYLNWINMIFLVIAIFSIDFFFTEVTDTRGTEPWTLFQQQFQFVESSSCQLASLPYGVIKGVDSLIWHFMQVGIVGIPDISLQILAWFFFLIPAAFGAAVIQHVFLGGIIISEIKQQRNWKLLGDSLFSKSFMITILILASIYFYAVVVISKTDFSHLETIAKEKIKSVDPCAKPDEKLISQRTDDVNSSIKKISEGIKNKSHARIDKKFDDLRRNAEKGIDVYLDWLFSVIGEYERLAMVFSGDVSEKMSKELVKIIFSNTGISQSIDLLLIQEQKNNKQNILDMADTINIKTNEFISNNPCLLRDVSLSTPSITRDKITAGTATFTGAIGARVTGKTLGQKTASMATAKIVNKAGFKAVINLIAKTLAKKAATTVAGGVATGAAAGLVCGPTSPICSVVGGIVGGITTWFIVDKIIVEIDEAINRESLRKEMIESIHQQLANTQIELKSIIDENINITVQVIQDIHKQKFNPARDGVGN